MRVELSYTPLHIIPVGRKRERQYRCTCIVDEYVQLALGGLERLCCGLDRREAGQVELQRFHVCAGKSCFDLDDGGLGFIEVARCEVNFCVLF